MEPAVAVILADDSPADITGRAWKLTIFVRFQVEVQDRTLAWTGPHSRRNPWQPQATSYHNLIVPKSKQFAAFEKRKVRTHGTRD